MDNKILFLILIFVVVITIVYFILTSNNNKYLNANSSLNTSINNNSTLSTNNTNTINNTKTNLNSTENLSTQMNTTNVINQSSCSLTNASVEYIPNGNFSTGTYEYWNTTGTGFGDTPFNLTLANKEGDYYGANWSNYGNTSFAASTYRGGLATSPGNITSAPFVVNDLFLNFKIISPYDKGIYLELLDNKTQLPVLTAHFDTYNASGNINGQTTFINASLPIYEFKCDNLRIKIVYNHVGETTTQYILATDFYLSNKEITTPGILYQFNMS